MNEQIEVVVNLDSIGEAQITTRAKQFKAAIEQYLARYYSDYEATVRLSDNERSASYVNGDEGSKIAREIADCVRVIWEYQNF